MLSGCRCVAGNPDRSVDRVPAMAPRDEVILRAATAEDISSIAPIWHRGWQDGHVGHFPEELTAARTEPSFWSRAAQRLPDTTIAEIEGTVAGFVIVVGDEVEQVYVGEDHRGSGVPSVLLAEAERRVRHGGHDTAWLAVVAGNERARRFTSSTDGLTRARSTTRHKIPTARSRCPRIVTSKL